MYQPPHFRIDTREDQHALITSHPLGLLISASAEGPVANAIPFLLDPARGAHGTLLAHMARANTQWQGLDGQTVLVVFQGPQSYISPSHYETKRETGKVVPTFNYVMVQARGVARVMEETAWLEAQIEALTAKHEATQPAPWKVSDAPRNFIESQLRGIVGLEIEVTQLDGKWKVSQNRPEPDRRGVAEGLAESCPAMAQLVCRYGKL